MSIKGNPSEQLHEIGEKTQNASDAKSLGNTRAQPSRKLYKVIFVFLLLAALLAFVVYSLAVAAIVCRIRDWKQQQKLATQATPGDRSNDTSGEKSQERGACHVTLSPFAQLLSASTVVIIIVNSVAGLFFLESLMLLPIVNACGRPSAVDGRRGYASSAKSDEIERAGTNRASGSSLTEGAVRDSEAATMKTVIAFALSDMECQEHTNDFILKLIYKTRCRDHLVIRVRWPATNRSFYISFPRSSGCRSSGHRSSGRRSSGPQSSMLADETPPSKASDLNMRDGESNFAEAAPLSRESSIARDSEKMQENEAVPHINPSVRWMNETDVEE